VGGLVNDGDDIYADWTVDFATGDPVMNRRYLAGVSFADVPLPQEGPAYFHADHLGTTRRLSQAGGSPPVRESIYTAFGELKHSAGSLTTRYGYVGASGYEESPAGGPADVEFIHVGARWYDPATGRFLQRDPIGIQGGLNVHLYVNALPVLLVDPEGKGANDWLARNFWMRILPNDWLAEASDAELLAVDAVVTTGIVVGVASGQAAKSAVSRAGRALGQGARAFGRWMNRGKFRIGPSRHRGCTYISVRYKDYWHLDLFEWPW